MLEIFDSSCILLAKAEQKHYQYTKRLLEKQGLEITPGQMSVLYALYKCDGISITGLSKNCYLDNSTLTGLIDRLERLDLVSRRNVPEDRRLYYIFLSEKAQSIREKVIDVMAQVSKIMLDGCSEEETKIFRHVLLNIFEKLG
jgi:DNA-binding MarR family transcriptional regulator